MLHIHAYSKKLFFGLQNAAVPHWHREKNIFHQLLNFMILQMVRNACVLGFGGHVCRNYSCSYGETYTGSKYQTTSETDMRIQ
jgi:hypothetical protein